jgi:drug/metabolite transporter (DMT)-like permease
MGELLALTTALLWALGVVLYKKSVHLVPPFALSVFKSVVALVLLVVTTVVVGQVQLPSVSTSHLLLILASGALGVGISDTLYFMALRRLGASRTALVDCLYSPLVIVFSAFMLREKLSPISFAGGLLILGSVMVSSGAGFEKSLPPKELWSGCALGAGAMATVAFAIVLVKPVLTLYPLAWVSMVRMAGGLGALAIVMPLHPDRSRVYAIFRPQPGWIWMILGTFFGSYLSLMCWLGGFKYSQAGIAALLNQMSTVLIVVLAALVLQEPLTKVKILAVGMAFAGAVLVLYSRAIL